MLPPPTAHPPKKLRPRVAPLPRLLSHLTRLKTVPTPPKCMTFTLQPTVIKCMTMVGDFKTMRGSYQIANAHCNPYLQPTVSIQFTSWCPCFLHTSATKPLRITSFLPTRAESCCIIYSHGKSLCWRNCLGGIKRKQWISTLL